MQTKLNKGLINYLYVKQPVNCRQIWFAHEVIDFKIVYNIKKVILQLYLEEFKTRKRKHDSYTFNKILDRHI